jgi:hypothetical protein
MNLYLDNSLASHRHGRFFSSQLEATTTDELPDNGMLLMHGKTFQNWDAPTQKSFWDWAKNPGCALLLVPPFNEGPIYTGVDWEISWHERAVASDKESMPEVIAAEVTHAIEGNDGQFDRSQGHQWADFSINTRFYKQHSGTGMFAATCLPLWSISLLEKSTDTLQWLASLFSKVGQAKEQSSQDESAIELQPTDYTILVCLAAWQLKSTTELGQKLSQANIKTIQLHSDELAEGEKRLTQLKLINENGITESGRAELEASPFGAYVDSLREEYQQ